MTVCQNHVTILDEKSRYFGKGNSVIFFCPTAYTNFSLSSVFLFLPGSNFNHVFNKKTDLAFHHAL